MELQIGEFNLISNYYFGTQSNVLESPTNPDLKSHRDVAT